MARCFVTSSLAGNDAVSELALSSQLINYKLGITPNLREQARSGGMHPVKADEIKTWQFGDTPLITGIPAVIEYRQIDPAEVVGKSGTVDDAANAGFLQVQRSCYRVGTPANRFDIVFGRLQTVFIYVLVNQRQCFLALIVDIVQLFLQVVGKMRLQTIGIDHATQKLYTVDRHLAQVDSLTAVATG